MGEPTFWERVDLFLMAVKHKILCKFGKHIFVLLLSGEMSDWCAYCNKTIEKESTQ